MKIRIELTIEQAAIIDEAWKKHGATGKVMILQPRLVGGSYSRIVGKVLTYAQSEQIALAIGTESGQRGGKPAASYFNALMPKSSPVKWEAQEPGWHTHPVFGGVCKDGAYWLCYPASGDGDTAAHRTTHLNSAKWWLQDYARKYAASDAKTT